KIRLDRGPELFDLPRLEVLVEREHDDGPAALLAPSDLHGGDVDVVAAQQRSDLADDAGPVLVREHEDGALGRELRVEVAHADDAGLAVEDCARDDLPAFARPRAERDEALV